MGEKDSEVIVRRFISLSPGKIIQIMYCFYFKVQQGTLDPKNVNNNSERELIYPLPV